MYGDHYVLVILRAVSCALAFLSFLLFFAGLGTQQWFEVTGMSNMSFTMSPIKFCDYQGTCSDIDWTVMPAPPSQCGVTVTELQDRFRTVAAFTALGGLMTIVVFLITVFTFGKSRKENLVKHFGMAAAASGSFGFIAAALWGYTVENYQYCGTTFCTYAHAMLIADSTCAETLGNSFNAVLVASTFMIVAALCALAHQLLIPALDVDFDNVPEDDDPEWAETEKRFGPMVRNFRQAQAMREMNARGGGASMRRIGQRRQAFNTDESRYGESREPTAMSVAPRNRDFPGQGFQRGRSSSNSKAHQMAIVDGEELADFRGERSMGRAGARSLGGGGGGTEYSSRGEPSSRRHQQQQHQRKSRNLHQEEEHDVWVPPRGSDYVKEPQSGMWWSARHPTQYVDPKTGLVLLSDANPPLWWDPKTGVKYEIE